MPRRHERPRRPVGVGGEVTAQIIDAMRQGTSAWQMPWHCDQRALELPRSLSGRRYTGINVLALWSSARRYGFAQATWGTREQWARQGCRVLPGETATTAVVYRQRDAQCAAEDCQRMLFARRLPVFNRCQVIGGAAAIDGVRARPLVVLADLLRSTGAQVQYGGTVACYRPDEDDILMPHHARFRDTSDDVLPAYAAVLLHELVHWTGAPSRLDRDLSGRFGGAAYAIEELIAELGSAYLCGALGISSAPRADHARYISEWFDVLRRDKRAIFLAASHAERAMQFLLGFCRRARATQKVRPLKER